MERVQTDSACCFGRWSQVREGGSSYVRVRPMLYHIHNFYTLRHWNLVQIRMKLYYTYMYYKWRLTMHWARNCIALSTEYLFSMTPLQRHMLYQEQVKSWNDSLVGPHLEYREIVSSTHNLHKNCCFYICCCCCYITYFCFGIQLLLLSVYSTYLLLLLLLLLLSLITL